MPYMDNERTSYIKLAYKNKRLSWSIYLALILAIALFLFILYEANKITDVRFKEKIKYTNQLLEDTTIHFLWIIDNGQLKDRLDKFISNDKEINFINVIDVDKNIISSKQNTERKSLVSTVELYKGEQYLGLLSVGYSTYQTDRLRRIIQWLMITIFLFFMLINALIFIYWRNDKKLFAYNESRYKSIFENIATPIIEIVISSETQNQFNRRIKILKINNAGQDFLTNLHPDKILLESNIIDFIPREIKKNIIEFDKNPEQSGTIDIQFKLQNKNFDISLSLSKYTSIGDTNNRYLVSIYDLTEFKNQVKSQQILQDKINTMQRIESIGKLAGGIAHDFNNILSSIMGFIEHSRIDKSNKHEEYFNGIERAAIKAREIVTQILFFSRNHEVKDTTTNFRESVDEALSLIRAGIPESTDITIHSQDEEMYIGLNPTQTTQVIMNLCTNSFHAMKSGYGKIQIKLYKKNISKNQVPQDYPRAKPGQFCVLEIQDNGCGIKQGILNKIFDPYFTTKPVDEGTGLGLSVVYGIVSNAKGFIIVNSKIDHGTTTSIFLPCIAKKEMNKKINEDPIISKANSAKVIFLDDNKDVTSISLSLLRKLNYHAYGYHDPLEVLKLLKEQPDNYDILISDVTMPNMSGIELAKSLRKLNIDIPIILISGYNSELTQESLRTYRIYKLLKKPFSLTELEKAIASAIAERKSEGVYNA